FDPFKPNTSLTVILHHGDTRGWAIAQSQALTEAWSDDSVLTFHVGDMLADRRGPARGLLAKLLLTKPGQRNHEANQEAFLSSLRAMIPPALQPLSWLLNHTALSPIGANNVAHALEAGDFAAVRTMLAHVEHHHLRRNEQVEHIHSDRPLTESDIRYLLDAVWSKTPSHRVRWLVFAGLEYAVGQSSPHASGFRRSLHEFLMLARAWPQTVIVLSCWSGALERLCAMDPALDRIARQNAAHLEGGLTLDPPLVMDPSIPHILRGLRAIFSMSFQPRPDISAWIGLGDEGGLVLLWPNTVTDPAARAAEAAARVAEIIVGLPMALLVPEWAMGTDRAQDRASMLRARPHLGWVPLDQGTVSALAMKTPPTDPTHPAQTALDTLKQSVYDIWS
ncbi:MAG: hypothetical protein AAFX99_31580, partial [Myxococcota bacterium]